MPLDSSLDLVRILILFQFLAKLFAQLCSCSGNGLVNDIVTFLSNDGRRRSQFSVINDIVNDKKGDNIVNDKQLYTRRLSC